MQTSNFNITAIHIPHHSWGKLQLDCNRLDRTHLISSAPSTWEQRKKKIVSEHPSQHPFLCNCTFNGCCNKSEQMMIFFLNAALILLLDYERFSQSPQVSFLLVESCWGYYLLCLPLACLFTSVRPTTIVRQADGSPG